MNKVIVAIAQGIRQRGVLAELSNHRIKHVAVETSNALIEAMKAYPRSIVLLSAEFNETHMSGLLRSVFRAEVRAKVILWCSTLACAIDYKTRMPQIPGFLYKMAETAELIRSIRVVQAGQRYTSPFLYHSFKRLRNQAENSCLTIGLSDREKQVFQLVSLGVPNAEISKRLVISNKTVNTFRYRLFEKLQVKTDVQLAHLAIKNGLIEPQAESWVN